MQNLPFPGKHPLQFSVLLLVLILIIQAAGVVIAQQLGLPLTHFSVYSEVILSLILVILVSRLGWWQEIGFRKLERYGSLVLFLPALALPLGNLTFGIAAMPGSALAASAVLALTSGFVEEVVFRGLMLRAFLPQGEWKAALVTAALFGFTHIANVAAGYDALYVVVQICYALAIGFGFGAMAIKGRAIWPLILAHSLGNFIALINNGQIGTQFFLVSLAYIVLFAGYGLYLMIRKSNPPGLAHPASES